MGGVALSRGGPLGLGPVTPDYREAVVSAERPLVLDPLLARAQPAARDVSRLVARGLLAIDPRARPIPDLASTWGVSGDGLVYRFELPATARWSDGAPLTTTDVAATIALVQRPDFPDHGLAILWKGVAVATAGDHALALTITAPRSSFAATVADLPILPRAIAAQPTATLVATATRPVPSSGPMMVVSSDSATVELTGNPNAAHRAGIRVVEIRLEPDFAAAARALADGQVDAVEATTAAERRALAAMGGIRLLDTVTFRFTDLLLNARRPGLSDPAVRRAVAAVVDRARITRDALGGGARPQSEAIPAGILWMGLPQAGEPAPALASRALDAAGWTLDASTGVRQKGGVRLSFHLAVPAAAPLPAVAAELASQLADVGIDTQVTPVTPSRFDADVLSTPTFDMAVADWDNGPDPDISAFWRSNATPPTGFNVAGLPADPFLDRALDTLATEIDPQLRADAAQRINQRLADEVPAVFLYAPVVSLGLRGSGVTVAVPEAGSPASRYDLIAEWRPPR